MKKVIVTTTINAPTPAIRKFDAMPDWDLIVVGDVKTSEYKLERGRFVSWEEYWVKYPELCALIGFNNTQLGRMVAFLEAHEAGADIVATIDDDCDPNDLWPELICVGQPFNAYEIVTDQIVFDPVNWAYGTHARGFPGQVSRIRPATNDIPNRPLLPLVQEMLWFGEADIDAALRLHDQEDMYPDEAAHFWSRAFSPINTQNTLIHGSVLKDHCGEIPFVGHVSDIWAGYLFQAYHPNSTIYCPANVRHWQERTYESVLKDLEDEMFSYRHTLDFLQGLKEHGPDGLDKIPCFPKKAIEAIQIYRSYFA